MARQDAAAPLQVTAQPVRAARREDLEALLSEAERVLPRDAAVWLVGDTTQLWEGWIDRVLALQLASPNAVARAVLDQTAARLGLALTLESPGDVIPLPPRSDERARAVRGPFRHFDPYSVAFRGLARGDEPDYRTALRFLRHGWMTLEETDRLLEATAARFTRETIAQDPAELRRKYRGLCQMWWAESQPGRRHRGPQA